MHLSEIVAANVDLVLPTCDPRIALVVDVPPQMPALFQNPADLHQVVLNLLLNARDTLHDKLERDAAAEARITVRVEPLAPANGRGPVDGQRLSVTDTGVGMPREVLERIFEPFFTTKEVGRGHRAWTGHRLAPAADLRGPCRGGFDAGRRHDLSSRPAAGSPARSAPRPLLSRSGLARAHSQERPS